MCDDEQLQWQKKGLEFTLSFFQSNIYGNQKISFFNEAYTIIYISNNKKNYWMHSFSKQVETTINQLMHEKKNL